MASFSRRSRDELRTCHPIIVEVASRVITHFDFTVLEGWRSKERQNEMFRTGKSKVRWPNSKHNHTDEEGGQLSLAVDVAPYPIDWSKVERFRYFAGWWMGVATQIGYPDYFRWGGDWDMDTDLSDQNFNDLGHFELREEKL